MAVPRKPRSNANKSGNGASPQAGHVAAQSSPKPVSSVVSSGDFEEQVRRRAYEIYEAQGRPEGHEQEHWQQAEAEVRTRTRSA